MEPPNESVEEVKRAARAHADRAAPGWTLIVVTIHDDNGLLQALEVRPAGEKRI